jgi:hypothetical protein
MEVENLIGNTFYIGNFISRLGPHDPALCCCHRR